MFASLPWSHRGGRASLLLLSLLACPLPALAQSPAPPAPGAAAGVATTAAGPEAAAPDDVRAELRALQERIATQEQELARQRQALQTMQARQAGPATPGTPVTPVTPVTPGTPGTPVIETDDAGDAAMEALLAEEQDAAVEEIAQDAKIRLYGFMDVGLQKNWGGVMETGLAPSTASTFVLGNVNLYFDATPAPDWRSLIEVRVTNLPDGADSFDAASGQTERQATEVQDTSATHGGLSGISLNGIVLERAHIDYTANDALKVRAGIFLTPYGIWNVDHGAPVRIMARPPAIVTGDLVPERQTGMELFGTFHLLPWTLEYHAYVSNGRALGATDFDEDKAIGGRLVLGTRQPVGLRIGTSFFVGSTEDVRTVPGVTSAGELGLVKDERVAFDETAGGADISLDVDRLRIRGEVLVSQRIYEDGKRLSYGGMPNPDATFSGGYLLTAYELPWYGLEPHLVAEFIRSPIPGRADGFAVGGVGLNIYFTAATQLRLFGTYAWGVALHGPDPENFNMKSVGSRLVVAF